MRHLAPVPLFANGRQVRVSREEFGVPPIFGRASALLLGPRARHWSRWALLPLLGALGFTIATLMIHGQPRTVAPASLLSPSPTVTVAPLQEKP